MATRVNYENESGEVYWIDVSEKARQKAIDHSMANDVSVQKGLREVLSGQIKSVGVEEGEEEDDEE